MLNYMREVHKTFFAATEFPERDEIDKLHRTLSSKLNNEDRRQLLELTDLEDELRGLVSLHSFTTGFKVAWGIATELQEDGVFSYEAEEERRAIQKIEEERLS